jgi:hypothetical protein
MVGKLSQYQAYAILFTDSFYTFTAISGSKITNNQSDNGTFSSEPER